jgi:hypothetical protein
MGGKGTTTRGECALFRRPSKALRRRGFMAARDSWRLANCALCHRQMRLCSDCDRFHRYCSPSCAAEARRRGLREAGQRYQATEKGRRRNCLRQQRHRAHVTHQSSPIDPPAREQVAPGAAAAMAPAAGPGVPLPKEEDHVRSAEVAGNGDPLRCTICGRVLPPFARRGFLPFPQRRYYRGPRPRPRWPSFLTPLRR